MKKVSNRKTKCTTCKQSNLQQAKSEKAATKRRNKTKAGYPLSISTSIRKIGDEQYVQLLTNDTPSECQVVLRFTGFRTTVVGS